MERRSEPQTTDPDRLPSDREDIFRFGIREDTLSQLHLHQLRDKPRELQQILEELSSSEKYGAILRAKGILPCTDGSWIQFDFVPEEYEVRGGSPDYTGRLCVIGSKLDENALKELFHL